MKVCQIWPPWTHVSAAAGLPVDVVVVGRWGDRHTQLGQLCAIDSTPPPQTIGALAVALMIGDEPGN
ncbi:hypothetical protein IU15_17040 [Mycobacterium tuberculosis]|nr:hypothetical protein IU15_17040 [Mycobacterium tuberculosis]